MPTAYQKPCRPVPDGPIRGTAPGNAVGRVRPVTPGGRRGRAGHRRDPGDVEIDDRRSMSIGTSQPETSRASRGLALSGSPAASPGPAEQMLLHREDRRPGSASSARGRAIMNGTRRRSSPALVRSVAGRDADPPLVMRTRWAGRGCPGRHERRLRVLADDRIAQHVLVAPRGRPLMDAGRPRPAEHRVFLPRPDPSP
jgi:hypothetical protein